jgi:YjbE family integral membrane protein
MIFSDGAAWLVIPIQIFFVDLLLGADNALLIALACRSLNPENTRKAVLIGTSGAIMMRLVLTVVAASLLALPFVKLVGALLLVLVAINVASQHAAGEPVARSAGPTNGDFWSAAAVIIVADSAMSLDNVVALAAIAHGNFWLLAAGVALSIPVLAYGGTILAALLRNAPGVIALGAALLGWIAGDMAISDPLVADWANLNAPGLVAIMPALGAAFVFLSVRLRSESPAPAARAPAPSPRIAPRRAAPPESALAKAAAHEPPEPEPPREPALAASRREDRIAIIGVLLLAAVAGLALIFVSYLDRRY